MAEARRHAVPIGERLTQVAGVVVAVAIIQFVGGVLRGVPGGGDLSAAAGVAATIASVELFAAACVLVWADGPRARATRAVTVVALVVVALATFGFVASDHSLVFSSAYGYGLTVATTVLFCGAGLVFATRFATPPADES